MALILLVGDSQVTAPLTQVLTTANHQVLIAHDCPSARACIESQLPDALVIDWSVCGTERMNRVQDLLTGNPPPALIVSTPSSVEERVQALESGVDDYLLKPFDPSELQARLQALLRRRPLMVRPPSVLQYGDLELNLTAREVYRGARQLSLTPTEFQLLVRLLEQPEQVTSTCESCGESLRRLGRLVSSTRFAVLATSFERASLYRTCLTTRRGYLLRSGSQLDHRAVLEGWR